MNYEVNALALLLLIVCFILEDGMSTIYEVLESGLSGKELSELREFWN